VTASRRDSGSATVEFVYLAVLLMVPLVYIVLAAFQLQRAAFAVAEAARQAGRAYVTAAGAEDGAERALFAANLAVTDQGLPDLSPADLGVVAPQGFCAGGEVTVTVRRAVELPLLAGLTDVTVSGEHTETIDPYRAVDPCG
jgi:Flp pilus assembly protein TadG